MRKKYPQEFYNISEKDGRVIITKKKRTIWIRKRLLVNLPTHDSEELTKALEEKLAIFEKNISPEFFEKAQVFVTKELADRLVAQSKRKGVKRIVYLTGVLE